MAPSHKMPNTATEKRFSVTSHLALAGLPALNLLLVAFTMIVPGGAYYRIFGVDPLAAAVFFELPK